jgi:anti-sigma regulatory factor (Ser/Thr protein kinase)
MTSTLAERPGTHAAAIYGSDDELLRIVVPMLDEAFARGECVLIALTDAHNELVRDELVRAQLSTGADVRFAPASDLYGNPVSTITAQLDAYRDLSEDGSRRVRFFGELYDPGKAWEPWARFEAAVDRLYDQEPLTGLCVYDRRVTPATVLDDVERLHRHLGRADGLVENGRFQDAEAFFASRPPPPLDPLERTAPDLELSDPTSAEARAAVNEAARGVRLGRADLEGAVYGASEVVANAHRYGVPPITFRVWTNDDRLVVTVTDAGSGPSDPFVGMFAPDPGEEGGLGLWLTHQLCREVLHRVDPEGFSVRITCWSSRLPQEA